MAIIQISKVQARSGNLVDLPQLDQGEFGWASDTGLLYIGKTAVGANIENVEVLTSYSNISFSQVDGAQGNLNISNLVANGQILTYDGSNWVNRGGTVGGLINLGNVSNVKLSGGGIGYVLETDGTGNLSWTPKGTLYTNIIGLSNANPIVMTVANTTPYTNKQSITITGANATNANSIVNGQTFYVKLAVDFPTSGNVTLYSDSSLTVPVNGTTLGTYTANSGIATAVVISGGGSANAGGSTGSIQFNNGGVIDGSANLTLTGGNIFTVTGTATVTGNANVGNLGTSTAVITTGNITTINSGLLQNGNSNVTITNNANVTINAVGGQRLVLTATGANVTGTLSVSGNANVANLGTGGLITATGNITGGNLITGGVISATGNANVGNIGATAGIFTTITGTLTTAAQPNITSTGTLTSLSVSGNANIGNIGTAGLITATGNVTAGNLVTAGSISATGNANIGNLGTTGVFATTLSATGNANVGNIGATTGLFTNITGTLTTASQPNITSTGTLASLSVSGNANIGNIGTTGLITATGNVTAGNLLTGGSLSVTGNANVGNLGTSGLITATGNVTAGNLITTGQISATGNITVGNITLANAGTITGNNMTLTTGANTNPGTITGNWSLSTGSRLQATYADLAEYYEADLDYPPGTVLEFGGSAEVTIAEDGTNRVAGVVSTNPAYAMNAKCPGIAVAIALQGRVPCKVRGTIRKGDLMISGGSGYARPSASPIMGSVIGKALQNFEGAEGVIEIAVGRL